MVSGVVYVESSILKPFSRRGRPLRSAFPVIMHSQGVAYLNACCVFATLQRRFYVKTDVEKSVLKTISTPGLLPTIPSYRCPPSKEGENTGSRYICCGYVRAKVRASLEAQKSVQSHPPGHARGCGTVDWWAAVYEESIRTCMERERERGTTHNAKVKHQVQDGSVLRSAGS